MPFYLGPIRPLQDRVAGKLAAIVADNHPRLAALLDDPVQFTSNAAGGALLRQALERNPGAGGFYHAVLGLSAYMQGDYEMAVSEIEQADLQKQPLFHIVAAVIYSQVGRTEDARREGAIFMKMRPDFIRNIKTELTLRNLRLSDQIRLIDGIRKVGIEVPSAG